MEDKQKKTIGILNNIVNILEDGKNGYHNAAEDMEERDIKTMLNLYAHQRADFSAQVQHDIRELGGEPEANDDLKGKIHRVWMDLRAAVTGRDRENILAECARGEKAALEQYEKAMSEPIPEFLKEKLKTQYHEIQNNLKKVDQLRS